MIETVFFIIIFVFQKWTNFFNCFLRFSYLLVPGGQ